MYKSPQVQKRLRRGKAGIKHKDKQTKILTRTETNTNKDKHKQRQTQTETSTNRQHRHTVTNLINAPTCSRLGHLPPFTNGLEVQDRYPVVVCMHHAPCTMHHACTIHASCIYLPCTMHAPCVVWWCVVWCGMKPPEKLVGVLDHAGADRLHHRPFHLPQEAAQVLEFWSLNNQ